MSATKVETPTLQTPIVTTEDVAKRAYLIYLEEGCPSGRHLDHWLKAEEELRIS